MVTYTQLTSLQPNCPNVHRRRHLSMVSSTEQEMLRLVRSLTGLLRMVSNLKSDSLMQHQHLSDYENRLLKLLEEDISRDWMDVRYGSSQTTQH